MFTATETFCFYQFMSQLKIYKVAPRTRPPVNMCAGGTRGSVESCEAKGENVLVSPVKRVSFLGLLDLDWVLTLLLLKDIFWRWSSPWILAHQVADGSDRSQAAVFTKNPCVEL